MYQEARRVSITITNEDFQRRPVSSVISRDSSCPPTSGWRERLQQDQDEERKQKEEKIKQELMMAQQQEKEKAEKTSKAVENKERKIRRVRKTSERRTRLDTINSESDFSVGILSSVLFSIFHFKTFFRKISETSDKSARRKKKEKRRIAASTNNSPPPPKKSVTKPGLKYIQLFSIIKELFY